MVEFGDPNSPYKEGIDNSIFILPAIIIISLVDHTSATMDQLQKLAKQFGMVFTSAFTGKSRALATSPSLWFVFVYIMIPALLIGFFVYKLVKSLRDKEKAKEEKKKLKQQRKEKENKKKTKSK